MANIRFSRFLGFLLTQLVFVGACKTEKLTPPEYQVYSKILSSFKADILIVNRYTYQFGLQGYDFEYLAHKMPELQRETYDDFFALSHGSDTLQNWFVTRKKILLANPDMDNNAVLLSGKDSLGTRISEIEIQGRTTFSKVGFNKTKTQAMVCDWTQTGMLSGSGYISIFVKRKNNWKLKYSYRFGIS